uniref:Uncharacterized protein n=1 Tax=Rhizophora mucronata TaxID=61149 RepID=A0A2P2N333_RHIMU
MGLACSVGWPDLTAKCVHFLCSYKFLFSVMTNKWKSQPFIFSPVMG